MKFLALVEQLCIRTPLIKLCTAALDVIIIFNSIENLFVKKSFVLCFILMSIPECWDDFMRKKFLFHLDLDKLYFDDVTILTSYYYSGIHECISLELQWFFVHNCSLGVREHLLFFKNTIFKDFTTDEFSYHFLFF